MSVDAPKGASAGARNVVDNIEAVIAVQLKASDRLSRHHVLLEALTARLARPSTTYLLLLLVAVWIIGNALAGFARAPDPAPFFWLQGVIGILALLMTTIVLTTQRVQGQRAEQHAHLDLQVNLLAEQKITKLISLVEELRRDMPSVRNRRDSIAEAMAEAVNPEQVVTALEERFGENDKADED